MEDVLKLKIRFRRSTASDWTTKNPVLLSGEPAVETDTGKFKIGDGVKTWTALPYVGGGGGGAVDSVNGATGTVVLDAADVGADPAGTAAGLVDDLSGVTDAAAARSNLGLGALATLSAVSSAEIVDGTIVNADIGAGAAIALSKLAVDPLARANHTGTQAQSTVTNLVSDLAGKAATVHTHSGADLTSGTVAAARLGTGAANNTTFLRGDGVWASEVPAWARMPPPYPMAAGTYVGLRSTLATWGSYAVGSMTVIRLWLPPAFDRLAIHAASGGNSTFRLGWYEQQAGGGAIDWASKVDCGTVNTTSAGIAATTVPGGTQTGGRWVYAACLRETATANPTLQVNTSDPDLKGLRFAINNEPVAGMWTPSVATGSLPASKPAIWDMFWLAASVFARVA